MTNSLTIFKQDFFHFCFLWYYDILLMYIGFFCACCKLLGTYFAFSFVFLYTAAYDAPKIPTLRKILGQSRKLRKENKKHMNAVKKYLHRKISTTLPIDNIYNMGNFPLSQSERDVLNKGLSFVCSPDMVTKGEVFQAFLKFKRRMLLHYHFFIRPTKNETKTHPKISKSNSNWEPPNYKQKSLQTFFGNVSKDLQRLYEQPKQNITNLSPAELTALENMKERKEMVIKPADKGGKIVLWPRQQYIEEASRQLGDKNYYEEQTEDRTPTLSMEIETFLSHLLSKGHIDEDCYSFLAPPSNFKTPTFYMLPKIHKEGCPGRPIISGCQSPTVALSQYLDFYLKPIVKEIPSFIKDTNHFLQTVFTLRDQIIPGSILVTMDVKSLYTNIPQDLGTQYCLEAMQTFYQGALPLSVRDLEQMFTFILKHNYFEFDNKYYLQIHGTAMGSPFAPNFANIFMYTCENQILATAPEQKTPIIWKRFIDDIFLVWTHGEESLLKFLDHCNQCYPTIKFTAEHSLQEINFLDTTIYFNREGVLESTLFVKKQDICTLLHNSSFHPKSCKKGIIYSQALRYRRIITNNEQLEEKFEILRNNLLRRGYNLSEITAQFNKVRQYSQSDLLFNNHKPVNETTKNLPFVIPYDNTSIEIGKILKDNWQAIENDEVLKQIWTKQPFVALKRHKNFKDILVRSKFNQQ